MISYHNGDLLESDCDIIAHQVNLQGVMGGGIARQIAEKYPLCERAYNSFCYYVINIKLGTVHKCEIYKKPIIMNCFSQKENFDTDYNAVKECFDNIKNFMLEMQYKTLGVPFNYGCGIANGDWNKVEAIFKELFENEPNIELIFYKLR